MEEWASVGWSRLRSEAWEPDGRVVDSPGCPQPGLWATSGPGWPSGTTCTCTTCTPGRLQALFRPLSDLPWRAPAPPAHSAGTRRGRPWTGGNAAQRSAAQRRAHECNWAAKAQNMLARRVRMPGIPASHCLPLPVLCTPPAGFETHAEICELRWPSQFPAGGSAVLRAAWHAQAVRPGTSFVAWRGMTSGPPLARRRHLLA